MESTTKVKKLAFSLCRYAHVFVVWSLVWATPYQFIIRAKVKIRMQQLYRGVPLRCRLSQTSWPGLAGQLSKWA